MQAFSQLINKNQKSPQSKQFDIQPHHIQFETNDSEASDTSYQSSLSSNQQNNLGNAEYFREEMSRFFINYPELLNQQLIGSQTNQKSLWGDLANDIINQSKQQPISLQGIAKRIAFYRQKTQQIDIIDLIVKEKDLILKQLDEQAKMSSQQNINSKTQNGNERKTNVLGQTTENIYFSWKKKHQAALINQSRKNVQRKLFSSSLHSQAPKQQNNSKTKRFKSLKKNEKINNTSKLNLVKSSSITNGSINKDVKKENFGINQNKDEELNNQNYEVRFINNQSSTQLKNILKFQPKTQVAKQLLQQIKRHHDLNDEIGIKKLIVNFLVKHRQTMKKNLLSKSNLNQRLSKLHIEDSKQLLLFCPLKKNSLEAEMPLNAQTNSFLQILNQISTGHLMKYWKLLQQKKL